jgi:xanthine dehydrogenase large subunit
MGVVGKNIPHDSAVGHVTGGSVYIDDIQPVRGELIVDFYWSRVSHARVISIDLNDARAVPGVVALFTAKDLAHNRFGPIIVDETLLAEDEILFMGHPLVVIAATSREAILQAKRAIRVALEELPPILTIEAAIEEKFFIGEERRIVRGDVDRAIAKSDAVLSGVFHTAGQDHFYLESQAAIVYPGENDSLVIHSSTQHPSEVQHVTAELLGLSLNQVVVVTRRMGGGFGGKECQATHPAVIAALVAHKTKRAARIVYTKDDDMQVTGKRHPFQARYRVGYTRDGLITALDVQLFSDGGAYADLSPAVMGRAMTHVDNAYFLEYARIVGRVCRTHTPPNTAFRGFGGPQGVATIENIFEELALELRKDAAELRRLNMYGEDSRVLTPYQQRFEGNHLPQLFEELHQRSDYARRREGVIRFNEQSRTHLRGISMTAVKFGISFNTKFLNQANAMVNIYGDGSIQVSTGATEMGQGVNTKIRQLVADEFSIDPSRVIVMTTSTEKNNNTSATAASSAADLNGSAAVHACRQLRARLTKSAADLFSAKDDAMVRSEETVEFADDHVFDSRAPQKQRVSFAELIRFAYLERVDLGARGFFATPGLSWDWLTGTGSPFLYFTQGWAVSEVLIDRFTGQVSVERADVLMDIGKPINPGIDHGQMTGAFIQGMGWVTTESLRYAPNGELWSHSPTTYKIPNIQDVPKTFNVDSMEFDNSVNIRGSKATGEPPLLLAISVWTAIKHALSFASGGAIPQLAIPASNEEIVMRLAEAKKAARSVAPASSTRSA